MYSMQPNSVLKRKGFLSRMLARKGPGPGHAVYTTSSDGAENRPVLLPGADRLFSTLCSGEEMQVVLKGRAAALDYGEGGRKGASSGTGAEAAGGLFHLHSRLEAHPVSTCSQACGRPSVAFGWSLLMIFLVSFSHPLI